MNKKYGIYIGRLQPMHLGHQQIINTIISDGLEPIIILGSAQESGTEKNTLTVSQRRSIIRSCYPAMKVFKLNDYPDWNQWFEHLMDILDGLSPKREDIVIYTHSKPEDLKAFEFRGINYESEYYTHMFHVEGMNLKNIESANFPVRASTIRADLENNKHFLDEKVYNQFATIKYLK
jgi:nicotinamide mononucleotide adenylyltransferase